MATIADCTRSVLIAFDIDDCLMPMNQPPSDATLEGLQELAQQGAHMALASGKPCVYLSGLARGLRLMEASLVGENGGEVWINSTMPPERLPRAATKEERDALATVREILRERFGARVYFQPNTIGVTAFPLCLDALPPARLQAAVAAVLPPTVKAYIHPDSLDCGLRRFDKGEADHRP